MCGQVLDETRSMESVYYTVGILTPGEFKATTRSAHTLVRLSYTDSINATINTVNDIIGYFKAEADFSRHYVYSIRRESTGLIYWPWQTICILLGDWNGAIHHVGEGEPRPSWGGIERDNTTGRFL